MSSPPIRVLYVDDEETLLDLAKLFLERTKEFNVEITVSAVGALELLKTNQFDAIISDYQMPEMDGINFLIEVRARFGDIPFILFTGKGREEVVVKAIDNGVDFYLQKGGDPRSQFAELAHKVKKSVERNLAVRALAENEERMRLALDGAREAHWEINLSSGYSYLSPRGCEMLGYALEEMDQFQGLNWRKLAHPDDIPKTETAIQDYLTGKTDFIQVEQRLRMKNGEWKWMLVRGKVVAYDEDKKPVRFVGTHTDITEQKKAQDELQKARNEWETIFRAIGNPTFILDANHTVIDANEAVLSLTGRSLEEIKGSKCWTLFHDPSAKTQIQGCPLDAMKKSGKMETVVTRTEALNRVFLTSCTPVVNEQGEIYKAIHIATDITDNIRLEQDLRDNHDYLNQIFSSVKEGILIIDANTHEILDVNSAAVEMIGAKKEDILNRVCHRYICPADLGKCPITDLHQCVDNSERMLRTAAGTSIPIIKYVVPFMHKGRACLLETFIDNTERKKTHDELLASYRRIADSDEELRAQFDELTGLKNALEISETKFRTIIETTPDMIFDLSKEAIFTYSSPRSLDILGYTSEELIGKPIFNIFLPSYVSTAKILLQKGLIRKPGILSFDLPCIHKNGSEIILNVRSSHLLDDHGSLIGFRCVGRDVTDVAKSTKALVERTKQVEYLLEQKDLFLNQLAHDLRTPLTPIVGMAPFLLEISTDSDARELIRIFLSSITYLQKMAEDILVYAQLNRTNTINDMAEFDIADLILDAIEANQYLSEQKDLHIDNSVLSGEKVVISKPYANLVFRNLINNAVKYNVQRGIIRIESTLIGKEVLISITDTGIGIRPDIIDKIWGELYIGDTSRHDPLSKGFGLPIVKKIVELHRGRIEAYSEGTGKGSTFRVYLPRTED